MRASLTLALSLLASTATADIYTCEINQRTVYSDTPCSQIITQQPSATNRSQSTQWWEDVNSRNPYKQPILLDGPLDERVDRVATIISDAWIKSTDCQTAISSGQNAATCKDFMNFIEPGTLFWQASRQYQSLNLYTKNKVKDQQKMSTIKRQIHDLVTFRAELKQHVKKQQLAKR